MKDTDKRMPKTISEFYRSIRPEYFSDSKKKYKVELPKEHFAYELKMISTNQKQDAFETLCRKLAEKFISPNLIPQVGPTGGGDGKTDTETYPVSETISDRWFTPENGWKKNENWAFAISSKEDWKGKIKLDVKKIIDTQRGYTKIYFFSNQKISSKKKKEAQDELNNLFNIEVIIIDGEWIIEKIYDNNLINIAVDSLNLSEIYKEEVVYLGENDTYRIKKLNELEEKISTPNRYFDYDYQLVEDALEAATLARMLEKPKDEVLGKFDRALRLGEKLNNSRQLMRIHYQMAWTQINWYDNYNAYLKEYYEFKNYAKIEPNIKSLELHSTLIQLLWNITNSEDCTLDISFDKEIIDFINILNNCIQNTEKPTTSLVAQTYKSLTNIIFRYDEKIDISKEFKLLNDYISKSPPYIEYPFELFKNMIEVLGRAFPNNKSYDTLIDSIADIESKRTSEIASGIVFLKRGLQKLDNNYNRESLIYLGKSIRKVAKEDETYLYLALRGLTDAYQRLGLYWAANNSLLSAINIYTSKWYKLGKIDTKLLMCVEDILKNESFIGRIPYLLGWHEMYKVLHTQFENQTEDGDISVLALVDACLSVRLLNTEYEFWKEFIQLPDILEREELWLSQEATLYMLGYTTDTEAKYLEKLPYKNIDEYFSQNANQPFREQIIYDTNLYNHEFIKLKTIILGTEIYIVSEKNKIILCLAETILAYLESFLATAFEEVFPTCENIVIRLINKDISSYTILQEGKTTEYQIHINIEKYKEISIDELLINLTSQIVAKNYLFKDAKEYLERLFSHDELNERQFPVLMHSTFIYNILGDNPKILLEDWLSSSIKSYPIKRTSKVTFNLGEFKGENNDNDVEKLKEVRHNQHKVSTVIDTVLWDNAHWKGFGFFYTPEIPFGITLAFEDIYFGKKIFEGWIEKYGKTDVEDEIYISIIRGINSEQPYWYRVFISKNIDLGNYGLINGDRLTILSRFHEMNAVSPVNLQNLTNGFNYIKQYVLCPASIDSNGKIEPIMELGILKKILIFKDAWEISELDLEFVAIKKGDKPIIPENKSDAPILKVLERKNK